MQGDVAYRQCFVCAALMSAIDSDSLEAEILSKCLDLQVTRLISRAHILWYLRHLLVCSVVQLAGI